MSYKPDNYPSLSPYLIAANPLECIRFMKEVLGGTELRMICRDDGSLMHGEVRLEDSVVMVGGSMTGFPPEKAQLHLYVKDVDATFSKAIAWGATEIQKPVQKQGDTDKRCGVLDPSGNSWWFATEFR